MRGGWLLVELTGNSRTRASEAWGMVKRMLEYKCDCEGTHFAAVDPKYTTKQCGNCVVKTENPPSCGFEVDRNANAAINILARGLQQ
ncbi:MAG: transposase [Haloquadratum walsbyi J07HQW2]|jgi:Transposase and inactivated derivatives|uniref:Transposase n=1 Tax=Haloquadratum walsbyi J07HQW2 TaxID=1238425 RepID=U1PLD4_9EURY|nr:MAG: transposase [Haloquadratum walsbyi J07HQW2]